MTLTAGADMVALGGPKQRLVLGLLVARAGHIVPIDDITDALWPEGPPAKPRKTVQVYVTRLRGLLADCDAAIQGVAAGYRFDPGVVELDAVMFEAAHAAAVDESNDELRGRPPPRSAGTLARRRLRRPARLLGAAAQRRPPRRSARHRAARAVRARDPPTAPFGDRRGRARRRDPPARRGLRRPADDRPVPGRAASRCPRHVPAAAPTPRPPNWASSRDRSSAISKVASCATSWKSPRRPRRPSPRSANAGASRWSRRRSSSRAPPTATTRRRSSTSSHRCAR